MQNWLELHLKPATLKRYGLPDIPYCITQTDLQAVISCEEDLPLAVLLNGLQQRSRDGGAQWQEVEPAMDRIAKLLAPDDTGELNSAVGDHWWLEIGPLDLSAKLLTIQRGDALGASVEFMKRTEILRRFGPKGTLLCHLTKFNYSVTNNPLVQQALQQDIVGLVERFRFFQHGFHRLDMPPFHELIRISPGQFTHPIRPGLQMELQRQHPFPQERLVGKGVALGDMQGTFRDIEGVTVPKEGFEPLRQQSPQRMITGFSCRPYCMPTNLLVGSRVVPGT